MQDIIIIGGGAAGLSAAIYSARYNLKTLVLAKQPGGIITESHLVENYPGEDAISGLLMMQKWENQAKRFGVEIIYDEVFSVQKKHEQFTIKTSKKEYNGKKLILATGTTRRSLGVNGEEQYKGRGVSFCATCDAFFFKNKIVGVIGGNDSAVRAAQLLCEYATKVYVIYRGQKLRAEPILVENIEKNPKIEIIFNTNIKEIKGEKTMKSVILDKEYHAQNELLLDGIFIEIGSDPNTIIASELGIELEKGYINVGPGMKTNIKGVYAAGDVTTGSNQFRQLITAASEGAIAAQSAYEEIKIE